MMLSEHGEEEKDTQDHASERSGQSNAPADNEKGQSHQNHEARDDIQEEMIFYDDSDDVE